MEQTKQHGHHEHHDLPRHDAGRVIAYLLVLTVLNALLAVYSIYMLGIAAEFDWTILKSGTLQVILESALQLLLFFSPVILTLMLNRLLYRVFRGYGRFPRGTWLLAMVLIVIVQVAVIAFIFGYGYVDSANGLKIEQLSATPLD